MTSSHVEARISVITPTIGRPASLRRLLKSLAAQTRHVDEVVIADGSSDGATREVVEDIEWAALGLRVTRIPVYPPHAVRQREAAIAASSGDFLLLLDDDVELETGCVEELFKAIDSHFGAVAAMADFNNQSWSQPTRVWRLYLRFVHGLRKEEWQGRVVGPLLRFGFNPSPKDTVQCEWIGCGNSLLRRNAFDRVGGFSEFFLHRSTINEDVDLGVRLAEQGLILFCPKARLAHFHDPVGRVTPKQAAEDDLFNRYYVLHRSIGHSKTKSFGLILTFAALESGSNLAGFMRRLKWGVTGQLIRGRLRAIFRIVGVASETRLKALSRSLPFQ